VNASLARCLELAHRFTLNDKLVKQARQISLMMLLLTTATIALGHPSTHDHGTKNHGRAQAAIAFDTYGHHSIRVWIDGVLINRRPSDYVAINQLRGGTRFVEIDVIGHRGIQTISQSIFVNPGFELTYAVAQTGRRGWFSIDRLYSRPIRHQQQTVTRRESTRVQSHGNKHINNRPQNRSNNNRRRGG
jgi:hypothetical protein